MSLYESLDSLVSAGLLAIAPAVGCSVPAGAIRSGGDLAAFLRSRGEARHIGAVLDALAQEVWLSQDTRGLPRQVAEDHARKLALLLDDIRPGGTDLAAALASQAGGGGAPAFSRRIAADILHRAAQKEALAKAGLGEEVAAFLLERLFARLLEDPNLIGNLQPSISAFLAQQPGLLVPVEPTGTIARPDVWPTGAQVAAAPRAPTVEARRTAAEAVMVEELRVRHSLSPRVIERFCVILDRSAIAPEQRLARLEEMAGWLTTTHDHLLRQSNEDAEVRRLKSQAAAALAEGDFEVAVELLKQVRRRTRDGRRRIEQRLDEEIQNLRAQMSEEALATAGLAELAMARLDFDAAAELFAEAADCTPDSDRMTALKFTVRQADALYAKGDEFKDAAALSEAAAIYADAVKLASEADDRRGAATASYGLANALLRTGERTSGVEKFKEAVAAYRRALSGITRQEEPRLWALSQARLASALALLGERAGDTAHYRDAAQAYRAALQELSRDRASMDWAMAQVGLGNTLLSLEEQQGNAALLSDVVEAFKGALSVLTPDRAPAAWASAQMNLGNALLGLGEDEGHAGRIEEAVAAYRQALTVFTRETHARDWSLVQMNLGNALASLGERDGAQSTRLEEAVAIYQEALKVLTRDEMPMRWAITQMNLGSVLIRLGERKDKRSNWLAAAAAMVPALEVFEAQGASEYAELTRSNLKRFHDQWDIMLAPGVRAITAAE